MDISGYKQVYIERYGIAIENPDVDESYAHSLASNEVIRIMRNYGYKPERRKEALNLIKKELEEDFDNNDFVPGEVEEFRLWLRRRNE